MNSIIFIYFNGTPLNYTKEELNMVYECMKNTKIEDDNEILNTLIDMDKILVSNACKGYTIFKTTIEKASKSVDMTIEEFKITWGFFCLYLISKRILKKDDDNGLLIFKTSCKINLSHDIIPSKEMIKQEYNTCGYILCGNKEAKLKCSNCRNIKYCSIVCQKQHWKNHKKSCLC